MVLLKEARTRPDLALVAECRGGDASAFDEIVRRYKDRLYSVIYRFLGDREEALDVCQEAFVRAYRGINEFRGAAQVYTWLYRIAANLARNRLRDGSRKGRDKGTSLEALEANAPAAVCQAAQGPRTPEDIAAGHELNDVLQRCIEELPEPYRLAFVLRTFDDLNYEEIAAIAECPVGTVKSRLNQARSLLRARLNELAILQR